MKPVIIFLSIFLPLIGISQFSGKIVSGNKSAIPFANVSIKGSNLSTVTDSAGNFHFSKIDKFPFTIVVTYIGFERQERQIKTSAENNILFQLDV